MQIIDGKAVSTQMFARLKNDVSSFQKTHGRKPGLVVVIVGDDPASRIYVGMKDRRAKEIGLNSLKIELPIDVSEADLLKQIDSLNSDAEIDGILVQLPLPKHIEASKVLARIDPAKDVDGFHPYNVGQLVLGVAELMPCTPKGCMILLDQTLPDLRGKKAVIVGRSNIVGKPMALMLLQRGCTVTVTHSATRNLAAEVLAADIVIAATGVPELIKGDWIKKDAVIIDVGISRIETPNGPKIVGDVAFDELGHAMAATPVPGGVGPMTIACLLDNTLIAANAREGKGQDV